MAVGECMIIIFYTVTGCIVSEACMGMHLVEWVSKNNCQESIV